MSLDDLLPARKPSSTNNDGGDKTRWLGRVRVLATEEHGEQEYTTTVAVWANSREDFDQLLETKIVSRHLQLLSCENAMPATKWLYHYPNDYAAVELAQGVLPTWPIAFGEFIKVDGVAGKSAEAETYLTVTEHNIPPLKEQTGIPFWEQEWIAPELKDLLFAQKNNAETLYTYLIVDATLRKKVAKFFDLDTVDVPVECLFKGEAADELKEVAPYLIDMTLPEGAWDDKDKVPEFHKDFFAKHWEQGTGILIRSAEKFDKIHHHFRKFLKIKDDKGKWFFLRYWDPKTLIIMQDLLQKSKKDTNLLFSDIVDSIAFVNYSNNHCVIYEPTTKESVSGSFLLDKHFKDTMIQENKKIKVALFMESAEKFIEENDPNTFKALSLIDKKDRLENVDIMYTMGIRDVGMAGFILCIIYSTGLNVLTEKAFEYVTKNLFLTPHAKARQLILAFNMITRGE